jgi:hypothetical protein
MKEMRTQQEIYKLLHQGQDEVMVVYTTGKVVNSGERHV